MGFFKTVVAPVKCTFHPLYKPQFSELTEGDPGTLPIFYGYNKHQMINAWILMTFLRMYVIPLITKLRLSLWVTSIIKEFS